MITAVKGMNDIRPGATEAFLDTRVWDTIFATAAEVFESYGYAHVLLPVVEETALFARAVGEETDIVSKEMYTFEDRGGRSLCLRPEGTAGAVRAYLEHNLSRTNALQRWWYGGPMYRAERPQKGRYRQFYQIGAELLGAPGVPAEVEMLLMLNTLMQRLGLQDFSINVNSLGDAPSREAYRKTLQEYCLQHEAALCESCKRRIHTNPLRVLDCKRESCGAVVENAPDILNSLSTEAMAHFEQMQTMLAARGLKVQRDRRLVRGLDYYTGLIFEFTTTALGAQSAILGGGRYDNLVSEFGGPPTPAVGFAAGVERLALLLAERLNLQQGPQIYLAPVAGAHTAAFVLADALRSVGVQVEVDVSEKALKHQIKRADKLGAEHVLVLGDTEITSQQGKLKHLKTGNEVAVALDATALKNTLLK